MPKILVLYYSTYGHVETLANAIVEGAKSVDGVEVVLKRVAETMPPEVAEKHGVKMDQAAPVASPKELGEYDAIIFGTPTRFGNMAAQMRNFLDQTGGLWVQGGLVGKVGSVFTSTGTGGGNESTIMSFVNTLMHHRAERRFSLGRRNDCRSRRIASALGKGIGPSPIPRTPRRHYCGEIVRLKPKGTAGFQPALEFGHFAVESFAPSSPQSCQISNWWTGRFHPA